VKGPFGSDRVSSRVPETLSQAQTWTKVLNQYLAAGLCSYCAGQCAWAHQVGFGRPSLHPPCAACVPVVATLTYPVHSKGSAWRRRLTPVGNYASASAEAAS
jgi:hypothetical protein